MDRSKSQAEMEYDRILKFRLIFSYVLFEFGSVFLLAKSIQSDVLAGFLIPISLALMGWVMLERPTWIFRVVLGAFVLIFLTFMMMIMMVPHQEYRGLF